MNRIKVIAQIGYSQTETWIARVYGDAYAVRLEDIPSLPKFGWMPVGTVEFCRAAMAHQGIVEYRFYVLHGEILGYGRYDDREDDPNDPLPLDMKAVREMIDAYQKAGSPAGYGLDVGVSDEDGMTKLVEVNDGWALGFYKGSCSHRDYLRLLELRWLETSAHLAQEVS